MIHYFRRHAGAYNGRSRLYGLWSIFGGVLLVSACTNEDAYPSESAPDCEQRGYGWVEGLTEWEDQTIEQYVDVYAFASYTDFLLLAPLAGPADSTSDGGYRFQLSSGHYFFGGYKYKWEDCYVFANANGTYPEASPIGTEVNECEVTSVDLQVWSYIDGQCPL